MNKLVDDIMLKIERLNLQLSINDISSLSAGLKDIIDSHDKIINSLLRIRATKDNDEFQDALIELQMELVNHIKPHIQSMEEPLMKVINALG